MPLPVLDTSNRLQDPRELAGPSVEDPREVLPFGEY
jgi:hypothetical protein